MDRITCRECYFWNPGRATDKTAECRRYPMPRSKEGWPRTMEDGWCGEAKALEGVREYPPETPRFSSEPIGRRRR